MSKPIFPLLFLGALVIVPGAFGQTGQILGSPNPCTIPSGQSVCSSTITWSSSGPTGVQVWVSVSGGSEVLFSQTGPGDNSVVASWIQATYSYMFRLYDYSNGTRGAQLSSSTVTAVNTPANLSFTNQTRPILGTNFVVGDYWAFSVSGGPPSVAVQIAWTCTCGTQVNYTAGYTQPDGSLNLSQQPTGSGSLGRWSGQWYVGGAATGPQVQTEVIAIPTSTYPGSGMPSGFACPQNYPQPYGFGVQGINYGVTGADFTIPMTIAVINGGDQSYTYGDVAIGGLLNSFSDPRTPFGICANFPLYSSPFTESFYVGVGGIYNNTAIRTNYWVQTSTSDHAGTLTNNSDITIDVP